MTKVGLQAEMADRLAVTDRVAVQLHALGGVAIQYYTPKPHAGNRLLRAPGDGPDGHANVRPSLVTVYLNLLVPYRLSCLRTELKGASDHLLSLKRHNHELLQVPAFIHYLTATVNLDLHVWSSFSTDIGLRMNAHPARVIDVLIPSIPSFFNLSFLARGFHTIPGITSVSALVPTPVPVTVLSSGPARNGGGG